MNKTFYVSQEVNDLIDTMAQKLNFSRSQILENAIKDFYEKDTPPSMDAFRRCERTLHSEIMNLQILRDHGHGPWTPEDNEILELLFQAHEPLMYKSNELAVEKDPSLKDILYEEE
jgi:hypothetical protein